MKGFKILRKIFKSRVNQWERNGHCKMCRRCEYCQRPCGPVRRKKNINDAESLKSSNWRRKKKNG